MCGENEIAINNLLKDCEDYHTIKIWFWLEYFRLLKDDQKADFASVVINHSRICVERLIRMGETKKAEDLAKVVDEFRSDVSKMGITVISPDDLNRLVINRVLIDASYEDWCWANRFWLNPLNDISDIMPKWMRDTVTWESDEFNSARIDDILHTFDHCRRSLHRFMSLPESRWNLKEGEDLECLVDCYFRLYSIMDKISKIICCIVFDEGT